MAYTTIDNGKDYFDVVTWTGNGSARSITGLAFRPDLVMIKSRNASGDWSVWDSSRGTGKYIGSDTTHWEVAERTDNAGLTAFNSNGFSLGTSSLVNTNNDTYVAWCWKVNAGSITTRAAGSPNYDPSVSYTQTETTAKVSIAEYQGYTDFGSYSHGLGQVPDFYFIKSKVGGTNHQPVLGNFVELGHLTAGYLGTGAMYETGIFFDAAATSTVVNCKDVDPIFRPDGAKSFVAYHWGDVKGYLKCGLIKFNGQTDGTFVHTGFRPRFLMTKAWDTGGANYHIHDSARLTGLGNSHECKFLRWSTYTGESTTTEGAGAINFDFYSNGFKCRSTDSEIGENMLFWAIGDEPFVTSTGVPATAN